jgi:hydroxyacylglutathione hydrolase
MSLKIHVLPALKDNFIYILSDGKSCVVIDPGEAAPVEKFLAEKSLHLETILCTHHHWDHTGGIEELKAKFNCDVLCSAYDFSRIKGADRALEAREAILGVAVEVLPMPGHTLGQVAFYLPQLEAVFTGDTLFSAGCGRLFEGTPEDMFESLGRLKKLPRETKVYFGHEYTLRNLDFVEKYNGADAVEISVYRRKCVSRLEHGQPTTPSSIGTELKINPFMTARDVGEFTKWRELRNAW